MAAEASSHRSATVGQGAGDLALVATACVAVAIPTLIAFNVAPSATFFNQAASFVGWGCFLLVIGAGLPRRVWPESAGATALLASLAILVLASLAASVFAAVPWSLSLSSAGTVLAAMLVVTMGACVTRANAQARFFRAFCVALVVAGIACSAIGLVQVFAPELPDGDWVALSALPGRATGNLRQPNHLSSLLLWSIVAAIWLGETTQKAGWRVAAAVLSLVFIDVVVLTGSRTGALGMLTLAAWGLLDRRLSKSTRVLLLAMPLVYWACWWSTTLMNDASHAAVGGVARFGGSSDISGQRFAIWSNALSLIASHPWLGVGFGEFNFAWTLTPFPHRPQQFFDHTHNLVLNFVVELGIPLALVVLALMLFALWRALMNAIASGRVDKRRGARRATSTRAGAAAAMSGMPAQRAAFVIVVLVAVHSMLEYPLWYAYFLLPAAFAFGLCLGPLQATDTGPAAAPRAEVTRPFVVAAMALILCGTLALYDYMRVVIIFAPPAGAAPLDKRIADGRASILFGHHADYAAGTVPEHPGQAMSAFDRAPHYLLDSRLMTAWARALEENGEKDKARYVAQRLREFHNSEAGEFFSPCEASKKAKASPGPSASAVVAASPATAASDPPFQCLSPSRPLRFEDFR